MNSPDLSQAIQSLANDGLNLFASVPQRDLPDNLQKAIQNADISLSRFKTLVLIGHGGKRLWEAMQPSDWEEPDPIDNYSQLKAEQFIEANLGQWENELLFPSDKLIPLQQIGSFVGWSHPSPLGLGINPQFGVWFAYRAAFVTTAVLPKITADYLPSPCDRCDTKPCIRRCPGSATHPKAPFNIEACAAHRLKARSSCKDRCLSRMACPFFPEHKYTLEQIQYHYGLSLNTFKKYYPHLVLNHPSFDG